MLKPYTYNNMHLSPHDSKMFEYPVLGVVFYGLLKIMGWFTLFMESPIVGFFINSILGPALAATVAFFVSKYLKKKFNK